MKIGFLGNTNNYPFMVARAIRRRGHDVLFIVDSDEALHRPEFRYEDVPYPYPDWIVDAAPGLPAGNSPKRGRIDVAISLGMTAYRTRRHRRIVKLLRECDALVLNAYGISFLHEVDRPAFMMLVGWDLETLADYSAIGAQVASLRPWYMIPWRLLLRHLVAKIVPRQREAIQRAAALSFFARGIAKRGDELLEELRIEDGKREFIMMTELDRIAAVPPPANRVVRIFCGTRFNFNRTAAQGDLDYKGSDIMIRGLADFIHRTGTPLDIRFVEKGGDVGAAKMLIAEVGITEHVRWSLQMTQIDIASEIEHADIIIEHLGNTFIGMMGLDSMAAGRPVIANARPEIFEPLFGEPSPICQATTVEEVSGHLQRLVPSAAERERVGRASRAYVEKFFSTERAADLILRRLTAARG